MNNLGIYLSKDKALAAVVSTAGQLKVLECFSVAMQANAEQDCPSLAAQISAELSSRGAEFESVSIAIDCTLYTQHDVHSSFNDYRQIEKTIKFDVEEVIGDDANKMAITFSIVKSEDNGSIVTVFSSPKRELTTILKDFQSHGLDPEVIEPDIVAFARAVSNEMKDDSEHSPVFVAFNDKICYNALINSPHSTPVVRSFLYADSSDKAKLLNSQLRLTLARESISVPADTICVFGDDIDREKLAQISGLLVPEPKDMLKESSTLFDSTTTTDISTAIAAGSSMAYIAKRVVDFRADFAPYQGKKRIAEISLRVLALAVSIFLAVFALTHTLNIIRIKGDIAKIETRTQQEYESAMKGAKMPPRGAALTLRGEVTKLRRISAGEDTGDDNTISSRLRYVLEAINATPQNINLQINSITISGSLMRVDGSTNSRANTQQVLAAIDKHPKLKRAQESLQQSGSVDSFSINIEFIK